ncbi:MAG: autotransporter-associated beta strand repeat-containing protein [Verrucomicrobiota bacterium]
MKSLLSCFGLNRTTSVLSLMVLGAFPASAALQLTGTQYTQDFSTVSSGLPSDWTVRSGATATALGTSAAFTTTAVEWGNTGGTFRNSAASTGLVSTESTANQSAAPNRCVGLRQTGGLGDPGGAFCFNFSTLGVTLSTLSIDMHMLSVQTRSTVWSVQVATGAVPASWTTLTTYTDPGTFGSTALSFNAAQLSTLNNSAEVWFRIVALGTSTGTGSRDTVGIDNFALTYAPVSAGLFWDSNGATAGAGATPVGTWGTDAFWTTTGDGSGTPGAWVAGEDATFSAGLDATGPYAITVNGTQSVGGITFQEGPVTLSGGILTMSDATPIFNVETSLATVSSVISGTNGLLKSGSGKLVLSAVNDYSGTTSISGGTVEISADTALGNVANAVTVNGTLKVTGSLSFPATRAINGSGILSIPAASQLDVAGALTMTGLTLNDGGTLNLTGTGNSAGAIILSSPAIIQGTDLSVTGITISHGAGASTISQTLNFGTGTRTLAVADAGAILQLPNVLTLGGGGTNRLIKTGAGTLVLNGANTTLNKVALGDQTGPVPGGTVKINNKDALGISQTFLNYGTIQATVPLTGAQALPVGLSIGGRDATPAALTGEAMDFGGDTGIFGSGIAGDVRLNVNTTVKFGAAFTGAVTSANLTGFAIGGTGKVTLASTMTGFLNGLKLKDSITVELNTAEIGGAVVTVTPVHALDAGTKLVIGTLGTTRTVTAYAGLSGAATSVLHFDIGGAVRGTEYDALILLKPTATTAGAVSFAGKIDVDFLAGFVPTAGQSFDIIDWDASITPNFAGIDFSLLPDIGPDLAWNTGTFATTGSISIVSTAVTITDQPDSVLVAPGLPASFTVAATTGSGTLTYQWKKGEDIIDGATSATYEILAAGAGDVGTYRVVVSNGTASVTSDPATLSLFFPIDITAPPQSQTVDPGVQVTFSVTITGTSPAYQWRKGGTDIPGAVNPTYVIAAAAEVDEGSYDVVITGPGIGNSETSDAATLSVNPPGIVSLGGNGTYTQNFDVMGTTALAFPNGWYGYKVAGTSAAAIGSFVSAPTVGSGTSTTGALYNFGLAGAAPLTDRALGSLASGGFIGAIGASFVNNSGSTIEGANVRISFRSEQWRQGTTTNTEVMPFEWKIGGNINDTTGWTGASTFDILEILPVVTTGVSVDGNGVGSFATISLANLSGLTGWASGQTLHIRWYDADDTGGDSAMAVDDFTLEISGVVPPAPASFWDSNGSVAGAGTTPTGVWGTDTFWSSNALGETATVGWHAGDDAFFSAGSDVAGAFAVTVNGAQDVSGLILQEGALTLSGGTLNFTDATPVVNVLSTSLHVGSIIAGGGGMLKQGPGALVLGGVNTFTGNITVGAGSVEIGADSALGAVDNDLILNGILHVTASLDLPDTRSVTGGGGFAPAAGTELGILGSVTMTSVTLASAGTVDFRGAAPVVGALSLTHAGVIQGSALTAGDIAASYMGGSATIENNIQFGSANHTVIVADAASSLTLSGALTLTGGSNNRLIKTGAGTLVLSGANVALNKTVLGSQGAIPVTGGKISFNNKDALGISQMFFNYGTLEATADVVGASALPIGLSLASRPGAVATLAGEDIEFAGQSDLFSATGTSGDIRIDVMNHTTFTGSVNGSVTATITGFVIGGSGTVTFAGTSSLAGFAAPLKVRDSLTVELNTDSVSSNLALAAEAIDLAAGTTLAIGTEGTTRSITAYNGLNVVSGAEILFDIGGTTAGTGYDKLILDKPLGDTIPAGVLSIAGTVKVSFVSGFTPALGQSFDLLDWSATATPSFTGLTLDLPTLPGGMEWKTDTFTATGVISIRATVPPITSVVAVRAPTSDPLYTTDSVAFDVTVTGGAPNPAYQWRKGGEPITGATNKTFSIASLGLGDAGTYDVVIDDGRSTVDSNDLTLTVIDGAPSVTNPASRLVVAGQVVPLQVIATGRPPLKIQWKRNGTNIAGATAATYNLTAALTNAGSYQCQVTNAGGVSVSTNPFEVGVITVTNTSFILADKSTSTFKIAAAGNNLNINWTKDEGVLPTNFTLSADKRTLTGKALVLENRGVYVATVTAPGGTLEAGRFTLEVFNNKPQIAAFTLEAGIVSGDYLFDIPYKTDIIGITPTTFAATGLPAGLKVDPKTGRIAGKPTKAGSYKVIVSASNGRGKAEYKGVDSKGVPLTIALLPTGVDGAYAGLVERHPNMYGNLGARLDITVATTGGISGSITFGASKLTLVGAMNIDVDGVDLPSAHIVFPRKGMDPVVVDFTLDVPNKKVLSPQSIVSIGAASAPINGWKQIWKTKTNEPTDYRGYYTFGLALPDEGPSISDVDVPQGAGYGSFTVAADGKLTVAGKTPEGETLTCAAVLGPTGQVLIYQTLFTPIKGTLLGVPVINPLLLTTTDDNTFGGDLSIFRPRVETGAGRVYKKGYGPVDFAISGGRYVAPAKNVRILGLTDQLDDVQLIFTQGGAGVPAPGPNAEFSISTLNKATLISASNPRGTALPTLTPGTGAFSGKFNHDDPSPRDGKLVKRPVTFQGMMVKEGAGYVGVGYFLMDKLPENGPPATTPTTSPKLSGHVLLQPKPAAP